MKSIFRIVGLLAMLATTGLLSQTAFGQTWVYRTYGKTAHADGTLTLAKNGDGYQFTTNVPNPDRSNPCWHHPLNATVEQTADSITITQTSRVASFCPFGKFVIKADGSGGYAEFRHDENGEWHRFNKDVLLTLKK